MTEFSLIVPRSYVPVLSVNKVMTIAKKLSSANPYDLGMLVGTTFTTLLSLGLNPDVLIGMSNLETDRWRSEAWKSQLNPGGIGITDQFNQQITFSNGADAALALGVHFMAYAKGHDNRFAPWIKLDPRFVKVHEAGFAGTAKMLTDLGNGKWATDPLYAEKVLARINEMA